MASPNKNMKTGEYNHSFESGYEPYKMLGHELPGPNQYKAPNKALEKTHINDQMVDGVSKRSGTLYTEGGVGSSPAKNIFKKFKNALGGGGADPAAQIKMKMEQMKAAVAAAKAGGAGAAAAKGTAGAVDGGMFAGIGQAGGGGAVPQHGAESHSGESVNPEKQGMITKAAGGTSGGGDVSKFGRMGSQSGITAAGDPGSGQGPEMAEEEMV
jgi:hypothetical protein